MNMKQAKGVRKMRNKENNNFIENKILHVLYQYQLGYRYYFSGVKFVENKLGHVCKVLFDKTIFTIDNNFEDIPQIPVTEKISDTIEIIFDEPWVKGEKAEGYIAYMEFAFGIKYQFLIKIERDVVRMEIMDKRFDTDRSWIKTFAYPFVVENEETEHDVSKIGNSICFEMLCGIGKGYLLYKQLENRFSGLTTTINNIEVMIKNNIQDSSDDVTIQVMCYHLVERLYQLTNSKKDSFIFYPINPESILEKNNMLQDWSEKNEKHFYAEIDNNLYWILKIEGGNDLVRDERISLALVEVGDQEEIEERIYQYKELYAVDMIDVSGTDREKEEMLKQYEIMEQAMNEHGFWGIGFLPIKEQTKSNYDKEKNDIGKVEFLNRILSGIFMYHTYMASKKEKLNKKLIFLDYTIQAFKEGYEFNLNEQLIEKGKQELNVIEIYGKLQFHKLDDDENKMYCAKINDTMAILSLISKSGKVVGSIIETTTIPARFHDIEFIETCCNAKYMDDNMKHS